LFLFSTVNFIFLPLILFYFHWSISDYVLLRSWVPYDTATYAMTWLAVWLLSVLFEVIKLIRTRYEKKWSQPEYSTLNGEAENPFRPKVEFLRALIHTTEVAWGFIVMLVVMTFNFGLFLAVLAGAFVGMLLVGRFVQYVPKAGCH